MQEASRFTYLLLYFPLLDARRLYGSRGVDVWLFPVLALCGVTILLFLSHYLIGDPGNTPSFLIFKGVFGYNPGGFRVFIGNQVLFVVATALLLAELASLGHSRMRTGGLALLIAGTYLSHTRGIWLGMAIVCTGVLLACSGEKSMRAGERLILRAAAVVALLAIVVGVACFSAPCPARPSSATPPPACGKRRRPSSGTPSSRTLCSATVWGPWCGRATCGTPRRPGPTS